MSVLAERRREYQSRLEAALAKAVRVLRSWPDVERVSLFGSYARGRRDLGTDLDLLVILRTDRPFLERLGRLYSSLRLGVDVDFFCYTPEEWQTMKETPFWRHALANEKVLYEKTTP